MNNKQLVIGILAHVDSGKTTLSEAMLFSARAIKTLGRVDHKNAFLDSHLIEKERGITIFSKQAVFNMGQATITLMDTPGHVDFSGEMERALRVLDYAILVISAIDGVQSHTETLVRLLSQYNIPAFIFVNKMDIARVSQENILLQLKSKLSKNIVDFSKRNTVEFYEALAECSDKLLESYLDNESVACGDIINGIKAREIFPCFFGSALRLDSVEDFLKGIEAYTKALKYSESFSATVFKITRDDVDTRLTHVKVLGGKLKVRDTIEYTDENGELQKEKINQLRIYSGAKYTAVQEVMPGGVCAIVGLNGTYINQGLGEEPDGKATTSQGVLSYRIILPKDIDAHRAMEKLLLLVEEDPKLEISYNSQKEEITIQLMGKVQGEILKGIILQRFNMDIELSKGSILYKETIEDTVEGVGHFEPLRHYAEVHVILERLPLNSGMVFESDISEDVLDKSIQKLIVTHLKEKQHLGVLTRSPLTDIKITAVAGKAYKEHTVGGDFREATYRAVRHALRYAKSILLEPWYLITIELPLENVGRAMADIQKNSGEFQPPTVLGDNMSQIIARAPAVHFQDYQIELSGYTKGRGKLQYEFLGYFPVQNQDEIVKNIAYNPDEDIENTADSVFCKGGAGLNVKWDKVYDYMHLDLVLKEKQPPPVTPKRQVAIKYCDSLMQDKELIAIFERAYGPIKRDGRAVFALNEKKVRDIIPIQEAIPEEKQEYLLIDGYNIIFAWADLKKLADKSLDDARQRLIDIMSNYQGFYGCKVILVFDAYKVKGSQREIEDYNNISVVYTKEAETADMYIERVTKSIAKKRIVRVATGDSLEQVIILGHGAFRISAKGLREEICRAETAIREILEG